MATLERVTTVDSGNYEGDHCSVLCVSNFRQLAMYCKFINLFTTVAPCEIAI